MSDSRYTEAIKTLASDLAGQNASWQSAPFHMRQGKIISIDDATHCTVTIGGDDTTQLSTMQWLGGYAPQVGDIVIILEQGTFRVIVGAMSTAAAVATSQWAEIGRATMTSASAAFTVRTAIPALEVTFTVVAGRRYRFIVHCFPQSSVVNDRITVDIGNVAGTRLTGHDTTLATANIHQECTVIYESDLFAAGSYTAKVFGTRAFGTGNCFLNAVPTVIAYLIVEEMVQNSI